MLYRQGTLNNSNSSITSKSTGHSLANASTSAKSTQNISAKFGKATAVSPAPSTTSTAKQPPVYSSSTSKVSDSPFFAKSAAATKPGSSTLPASPKKSFTSPAAVGSAPSSPTFSTSHISKPSSAKITGSTVTTTPKTPVWGSSTSPVVSSPSIAPVTTHSPAKTSQSSGTSKISFSSYNSFKFDAENEKILDNAFSRTGQASAGTNSLQKLRTCLSSRDPQIYMNAIAVAGLSIEKTGNLKELFVLLTDGDPWVVANLCEALINSVLTAKQNPKSPAAVELLKLSISNWNEIGQHFVSLPSKGDQRMNILKFLANALSFTGIISNFLKSKALASLSSKIWEKDSQGRFHGTDEECHALLVIMNNLAVSSKPEEWRHIVEDVHISTGLANVISDQNHLDRAAIAIQVVNSLCQESSFIKYFTAKEKSFLQGVLQLLKSTKLDANLQLRLSRLCGTLMQDYDGLKQLTNGGVFKFYSASLNSATNDEIVMAILATLANLALSDHLTPNLPKLVEESRVLNAIQALLTKPQTKPETRIRAGIAISNLMTVETLQAPFASSGGIKALLATANMMSGASNELEVELYQKSLSALFHLSLYYDSIRTTMVQEGVLKSIGGMLSNPVKTNAGLSKPQAEVLEKAKTAAMKTLYNVSMTDGTEVEFVKQNVVPPLLAILKTTATRDEDQQISAAILENLAQNELFQNHLLSTGGVDSVLSLAVDSTGRTQERAARLVARLAVNGNVRRHLQSKGASQKLKSSASAPARNAIDMALHNIDIPVEDDTSSSDTASTTDEEDLILTKMATEFDLDDDGSINDLQRLLRENNQPSPSLSIPMVTPTPASPKMMPKVLPKVTSPTFPRAVPAPSPPSPSKTVPSLPVKTIPAPEQAPVVTPTAIAKSGPPALPPKPPPKPAAKKVNAARRALMSQPPPRPGGLVKNTSAKNTSSASPAPPRPVTLAASSSSVRSAPDRLNEGEEDFEDRGIRKESYMLVGNDTASQPAKKKKHGLLSSLKNLFSSGESHESELANSLHTGPWQVDEAAVSQKCPSLIYDYYDHWCESCKRDGSLCVQSADELRKMRMAFIRAKEPKSFAPPKTRDRANSDPFVRTSSSLSAVDIAKLEMQTDSSTASTPAPEVDATETQEHPIAGESADNRDASAAVNATLHRPPPPQGAPPMASMPIPQKIVLSPRKPLATTNNHPAKPHITPNTESSSAPVDSPTSAAAPARNNTEDTSQADKLPSHPPKPSLVDGADTVKKALPSDVDPDMVKRARMHVKRTHVAQELLTTEGTYMQNLAIILKKFQAPLTSSLATPKPLISESDIKTIFGSVEIIYNINLVLIERLNMKMRRWTTKQTLGDVFIYMADWLKIYTDYINNYDKSQSCLLRCKEESPRFAQFLVDRSLDPVCALRGLETLLVTPIQRPPRYSLLLRELIKNTDESHPDWADLNKASGRIEAVTAYLNEKRREFEARFKMFTLAHSLTSSKIRAQIVQPHRENLLESMVQYHFKANSKSGSGRLYLLNDAFLLTKITSKTRQKLVRLIPLAEIGTTIPPFASGVADDPHLRELTLLHIASQEFILITFDAVELRDQMYNQYLRLQPSDSLK